MPVPSKKVLRTEGQKAKAKAGLRLKKQDLEPGDVSLDQRLELTEKGPAWEVWSWQGQRVGRNQVVEILCREVAAGAGLSDLCRLDGLPSIHVFMGWIRGNPVWKTALKDAEEIRAIVLADQALERARNSGQGKFNVEMNRIVYPTQVEQKGDELFVKTAQWHAERTNKGKFGLDVPLTDLKDELRQLSEGALMDRLVAALSNTPAVLEKLAPQIKEVLPEGVSAELEQKALEARREAAIPGEVLP